MNDRQGLLQSIADIIADYRVGEIARPTPDHVERWITQFELVEQIPMLREYEQVLKRTYLSQSRINTYWSSYATTQTLVGANPADFWRNSSFLNIQQWGYSQNDLLKLFGQTLQNKFSFGIEDCASESCFIYLDDVIFSGKRVFRDLRAWLNGFAPASGTVHILVIWAYESGTYWLLERLTQIARSLDKSIVFTLWTFGKFENRRKYRDDSEVFWPVSLPDSEIVEAYVESELVYPFEPRQPKQSFSSKVFSSESGRQTLEAGFTVAGVKIRSECKEPDEEMRPV